jgi:hypothetical protein
MVDWHSSMTQTFEYYTVDPKTWKDVKLLDNVKSCTITRDADAETLGSATIDITESVGEAYIRVYLITIQNGMKEKHPLGTFLVQTPSSSFDGKIRNVSMDAYTPLLELKESYPPIGYSLLKGDDIMSLAYRLVREHARAPVVETKCSDEDYAKLLNDFVAEPSETWLSFLTALIANSKYAFDMDEMGRILFAPKQDTASLQPVWTFSDDDDSILQPELTMEHDLYCIPNVVEVVYSKGIEHHYVRVVNDDVNSPTSIPNRGREIIHRVTDPELAGNDPTKKQLNDYAEQLLRDLSTIEYSIRYTHGYCPARVGDCVRLNYTRAKLTGIKAKIVSQSIKCIPGCPVSEKAIFTTKLWR